MFSQPSGYLAHLIGHEGPGSVLSELKRLGWSNSLAAGSDAGARGYESFIVSVDLTEEGLGMCLLFFRIYSLPLEFFQITLPSLGVIQYCVKILSWLNLRLMIKRLLTLGSIPKVAMRRCVLGKDTLRLFPVWDEAVYPVSRTSLTKDLQNITQKGVSAGAVSRRTALGSYK